MDCYTMKNETIILAAGCFWGVQHLLDQIPGVLKTRCGYIGGKTNNPTYRDVCTGETQHAEAVEVVFDPAIVQLETIVNYFWRLHDPTQLNRQGPDVGTQYRSAIFYTLESQLPILQKSKEDFNNSHVFSRPAVTEIVPAGEFFSAEEYHQKYFVKNPHGHVCHILRPR
jgi:methionine-S-sulfoxide reductase